MFGWVNTVLNKIKEKNMSVIYKNKPPKKEEPKKEAPKAEKPKAAKKK